MRVICGGDTGVVKVVNPENGSLFIKWGEQKKTRSITHMCWADPSSESEVRMLFPCAHQNRLLLLIMMEI